MKRIIIHWTGGANTASEVDLQHYHRVIDGAGRVHAGKHPISANAGKLVPGQYAAHTLNCNTGSIGVAIAAMAGANERPFSPGKFPITVAQEAALTALLLDLCREYQIPVTRETVLTHAEVQPTLMIAQRGKWDITWLPGMDRPGAPLAVGDVLRQRVRDAQGKAAKPATAPAPEAPGWLSALIAAIARIFGGRK